MRVAVVAMACEFPEAQSPEELWTTVLHGRRCFRAIPDERLVMADYAQADSDGIYPIEAGLLEGYAFDRARFRVPHSAFVRTDMAHWLALDVASRTLASLEQESILAERDNIAVIVANTLTGEFSRAHALRHRWPYVARAMRAAAGALPADADLDQFLAAAEASFKAPLPDPDEDSLAGALSNTIAGRIANYHDLRGGAHTVDGACASSLVAITTACDRLAAGDVGCVLVGAVDLSLDPFELVGFARNGALARRLMHIFDDGADGFWPGEGCGFLMLATEALVQRHSWPVLGWVRGSAMSTDGEGALTRPSADGQTLAARRAWAQAGLNPVAADYFEAHGTGTPTGDPIELEGLAGLLGSETPAAPIPVGSIKANFGHTKAAAGMAGMLKALMICRERVIPATTGCEQPLALLSGPIGEKMAVRACAQAIAHARPVTVGVNSFGFGGINCHVVLEGPDATPRSMQQDVPWADESVLPGELFQLTAASAGELAALLQRLAQRAATLSRAQMPDLAGAMDPGVATGWRACVLAATPAELATAAAEAARSVLAAGASGRAIAAAYSWSAPATDKPRVAFLFPGQGSSFQLRPQAWAGRFSFLSEATRDVDRLGQQDLEDTAVVQPLLAEIAMGGMQALGQFGVVADVVLGHSFGELPALHCAGRMSGADLRALAAWRGTCMRDHAGAGKMVALRADRATACALASKHGLELACENGAQRFVLSGEADAVDAAVAEGHASQLGPVVLAGTRAFHSRSMGAAAAAFALRSVEIHWQPASTQFVSSVAGQTLPPDAQVASLLAAQLTQPVLFSQGLDALGEPDLLLELGSCAVLTGLASERYTGRTLSLDLFGDSPLPFLAALGAVWVCGGTLKRAGLYEHRLLRPCSLDKDMGFLANPCGQARGAAVAAPAASPQPSPAPDMADVAATAQGAPALATLKAVIADLTGLPLESLDERLRLLSDLHLNSIRARHAIAQCAQRLGIGRLPFELARFANARIEEVATHLESLQKNMAGDSREFAGVAPWLRMYQHAWTDIPGAPVDTGHLPACSLIDSDGLLDQPCLDLLRHSTAAATCLLLVLPRAPGAAIAQAMLDSVHAVIDHQTLRGILVLQQGQIANAFMQSAALDLPDLRFCVVEYDRLDPACLAVAMADYQDSSAGYSELRMRARQCHRRQLALMPPSAPVAPWSPMPGSVLLVTGGASGIGAASAAAMARTFGCKLALLGRSAPERDTVQQALAQLRAQDCEVQYFQADLAVAAQAADAVAAIEIAMGPIRGVLHAAGINQPVNVASLDRQELAATVASKVGSLKSVLGCLPTAQLELLVGYGSIIGELGLAGEAHYALANQWLGQLLAETALARPACRTHLIAWSAWREVGMAARLDGVLDGLRAHGTRALETDEAIAALLRIVRSGMSQVVLVCGRYGRPVSAADQQRVQAWRYLERLLVDYPGVELIAEATLCSDTDRYLLDHAPHGVILFPMACAIEAMLSAAVNLGDASAMPDLLDFQVGEAIACAIGQRFTLRTCALRMEDGAVQVQLRSDTTGYDLVHFSAVFSWHSETRRPAALLLGNANSVDAAELLYRGLCFHGPRFRQLGAVRHLSATSCQVSTRGEPVADWLGPFLPTREESGAPALRDAVMHALQLCVPHQVVLPVAVAAVHLCRFDPARQYLISAHQRFSDGTRFVFDIDVYDQTGLAVEWWRGLELRLAAPGAAAGRRVPMAPVLLEPLIGRLATDLLGVTAVEVSLHVGMPRHAASALVRERAAAQDGRSTVASRSATHFGEFAVVLEAARDRLSLDLQFAADYTVDAWQLMLGSIRWRFALQLAQAHGMTPAQGALCTWSLSECLIKLGVADWPLVHATVASHPSAAIGDILTVDCGPLRCAFALVQLAGQEALAALALARTVTPELPAVAPAPALAEEEER